jgi:amino acid transporter
VRPPALGIVFLVTALVFVGIKESKRASNVLVALKLGVIFLVIVLGAFYVQPENWSPFAPNGASGVMKGVAAVFFAYIGFDALSTTAEECKDPQRDLPRGMIYSLVICTVLYILIALVLTGMVPYNQLAVGDPLAYVFGPDGANLPWISGIIAISAVVALTTVLLVFQLGQPRIWMAMSRDGLLPPIFSAIHPRFRTPWFATIVTGILVAIPALFMNLTEVTDLASIGTLFAFVLVCGGVLVLDREGSKPQGKFVVPYVNSRFIIPALLTLIVVLLVLFRTSALAGVFGFVEPANPSLAQWLANTFGTSDPADPTLGGWEVFKHRIPIICYCVLALALGFLSFTRRLSLIPVLGLLSCGYLMTELGITNWIRFGLWMLLGLVIYFLYGYRHSKLGRRAEAAEDEAR